MAYIDLGDDTFNCSNGVLQRVTERAMAVVSSQSVLHPLLVDAPMYGALELTDVPVHEVELFLSAVHLSLQEWLVAPPFTVNGDEPSYRDPWYEGIALRLAELADKLVRSIVQRKRETAPAAPGT
jgi:hypothetical protein